MKELESARHEVYEDEISLTDIVKVIIKRRKTLYTVFLAIFTLSIAAAFLFDKKYEYSAVIEIGTTIKQSANGVDIIAIDAPETVAAKLQHSYIPYVLSQYYKDNPDDTHNYKLSASVPKKSELVKVSAKASEKHTETYLKLLGLVIQQLKSDHTRLFEISRSKMEEQVVYSRLDYLSYKDGKKRELLKKGIEQQIQKISGNLKSLADQKKLEQNKKTRYLKTKALLEKQLKGLTKNINSSIANRSKAKIKVESSSDAMTLLLIDNEIQQYRNQMIALETRVYVDIANKIEESENNILKLSRDAELLEKQLANKKIEKEQKLENHDRDVLKKAAHFKQVEITLNNSKQTNALVQPMQSIESVGLGKKVLILLGLFVGFFVGVFAVFVHEFSSNLKNKIRADEGV